METDGFDRYDDGQYRYVNFGSNSSPGGGAGVIYGNGSGISGGGGSWMPTFTDYSQIKTQDKEDDMTKTFTNQAAAELAAEILKEQEKDTLKTKVEGAIELLQEMLVDCDDGSTLTFFRQENEDSQRYYYAAVKSVGRWFTTAADRVKENDAALIEWLIGLEVYASADLYSSEIHRERPKVLEA
jgi:hypothetical protein